MPRIKGFTEEQKRDYAVKRRQDEIIRGLHAYKGVNNLTYESMAKQVGISHGSLFKIMKGQGAGLTLDQWLRVVSLAGLEVTRETTI